MWISFIFLFLPAFAQGPNSSVINVISERSVKSVKDITGHVLSYDRSFIERSGAINLKDFLQTSAGINTFSSGAGQVTSVQIRGNDHRHTLIMIDGQRYSDITSTDGNARLEAINLDSIENIEVVAGPQGVFYGSGAMGGVINITTRKKKAGSHVGFSLGNYGDRRAKGSLSKKGDKYSFALNMNAQRENGISAQKAQSGGTFDEDSSERFNIYGRGSVDLGAVKVSHFQSFVNMDYDYDSSATDQLDARGDYRDYSLGFDLDFKNTKVTTSLSHVKRELGGNTTRYEFEGKVYNLNLLQNHKYSRGHFSWGVDSRVERAQALGEKLREAREQKRVEVYANHDFKFEDLILSVGARGTKQEQFDSRASYRLGASYLANSNFNVKANLVSGFKLPSLYQRYAESGGNNELSEEKSTSVELISTLNLERMTLTTELYQTKYESYIDYDLLRSRYYNVGEATLSGVDITTDYSLGQVMHVLMKYSYLDSKDELTGLPLKLRPYHSGSLSMGAFLGDKSYVKGTVFYKGERKDISGNLGDYTLMNFLVRYSVIEGRKVTFNLNNLLDREYEEVSGFNTRGRNFLVSYEAAF